MAAVCTADGGFLRQETGDLAPGSPSAVLVNGRRIKEEDTTRDEYEADGQSRRHASAELSRSPSPAIKEEPEEDFFQIRLCEVKEDVDERADIKDERGGPDDGDADFVSGEWISRCVECDEAFGRRDAYLRHLQEHAAARHGPAPQPEAPPAGRSYECPECGKTYVSSAFFLKHQRSHWAASQPAPPEPARPKERAFLCPECGRSYSRVSALEAHRRGHEVQLFKLPRPRARRRAKPREEEEGGVKKEGQRLPEESDRGEAFLSERGTHQRLGAHAKPPETKEGKRAFVCPSCAKEFVSAVALGTHQRWHARQALGREGTPALCEDCGKVFSSPASCARHRRAAHSGGAPAKSFLHQLCQLQTKAFACQDCGRRFSRASALRSHRLCHSDGYADALEGAAPEPPAEKLYLCDEAAPRQFAIGTLSYSRAGRGPGGGSPQSGAEETDGDRGAEGPEDSGREPEAPLGPGRGSELDVELGVDSSEETGAGRRSPAKAAFECLECSRSFSSAAALRCHRLWHRGRRRRPKRTGGGEGGARECPECGVRFSRLSALRSHQRRHAGPRPHRCQQCAGSYSSPAALYAHRKAQHSAGPRPAAAGGFDPRKTLLGPKMYSCEACGKGFWSPVALQDHRRRRHSSDCKAEPPGEERAAPREGFRCVPKVLRKCAVCGKAYRSLACFLKHQRGHAAGAPAPPGAQEPYSCPECRKPFSRATALQFHMQSHGYLIGDPALVAAAWTALRASGADPPPSANGGSWAGQLLGKGNGTSSRSEGVPGSEASGPSPPPTPAASPVPGTFPAPFSSLGESRDSGDPSPKTSGGPGGRERPKRKRRRPLACSDCGERFFRPGGLGAHWWYKHCGGEGAPPKPFPCPDCDKSYSSQGALYNHRKGCGLPKAGRKLPSPRRAPAPPPSPERAVCLYKCPKCGKAFSSRGQLQAHGQLASARPHCCALCCRGYWSEAQLQQHLSWHDEVRRRLPVSLRYRLGAAAGGGLDLACRPCGRTFAKWSDLDRHQLDCGHRPEEVDNAPGVELQPPPPSAPSSPPLDPRPHVCPDCGMGFPSSPVLQRHRAAHSGQKPFRWSLCPKAFARRPGPAERSREPPRERGGAGEGPLSCIECGIAFGQESKLHQHYIEHAQGRV
ncbi:zinc finger protein 585B [Lepisosteus oculatus]|uniref:zinc finger protein 585B n=1 Tax=Lepisosteus oculatus TaxID=7918 RepID=UPI0037198AF9